MILIGEVLTLLVNQIKGIRIEGMIRGIRKMMRINGMVTRSKRMIIMKNGVLNQIKNMIVIKEVGKMIKSQNKMKNLVEVVVGDRQMLINPVLVAEVAVAVGVIKAPAGVMQEEVVVEEEMIEVIKTMIMIGATEVVVDMVMEVEVVIEPKPVLTVKVKVISQENVLNLKKKEEKVDVTEEVAVIEDQ